VADHDHGAVAVTVRPAFDRGVIAAQRSGQQPRIQGKIVVGGDIDDGRGGGEADETVELFDGNGVRRRHAGVLVQVKGGTRCFGLSPRGEIAFPMAAISLAGGNVSRMLFCVCREHMICPV
jgi:hypothetical protein